MKNRTILGIVCIVLAVAVMFGAAPLVNTLTAGKVEIVRFSRDVPQGTRITADDVAVVEVGKTGLQDNAVKLQPYRRWKELIRPDSRELVLMDNNILASDFGLEQLCGLVGSGYRIDLNQGMDARLVTPEVADLLSRLDWIRFLRFSCDEANRLDAVIRTCELLGKHGVRPYRIFIYLLVTKDIEDAALRVGRLKQLKGINLYAQAERNDRLGIMPEQEQLRFVEYVYSGAFRKCEWPVWDKTRRNKEKH